VTDLTDHLAEQRTERVKDIINKADFSQCKAGPDMKEVYQYQIDCLAFMVNHQKSENDSKLTLLGGKLLDMQGIKITGRDVVLLCVIACIALIALKDVILK